MKAFVVTVIIALLVLAACSKTGTPDVQRLEDEGEQTINDSDTAIPPAPEVLNATDDAPEGDATLNDTVLDDPVEEADEPCEFGLVMIDEACCKDDDGNNECDEDKGAQDSPSQDGADLSAAVDNDPGVGVKDSDVTLLGFLGFDDKACGEFFRGSWEDIKKAYVDKGDVRLVVRDYINKEDPLSLAAAEAASCAREQGKYWEYYSLLYSNQDRHDSGEFLNFASELELEMGDYSDCIAQRRYKKEAETDTADGMAAGVTEPGFIIGILSEDGKTVSGSFVSCDDADTKMEALIVESLLK